MAGIDVRVYNQHAFRYAMHSHLSIAYLKAGFVYFAFSPAIQMAGIRCRDHYQHAFRYAMHDHFPLPT